VFDTLPKVLGVWIKFRWPRGTRAVAVLGFAAQHATDGLARALEKSRDFADAFPLSGGDLDFHLKLLCKHGPGGPREVRVGPFSTGGVGHFYPGANTVMRKLLVLAYGILRSGVPSDANYA
jgi:hypothetical protein